MPAFHASAYRETVRNHGLYLDGFSGFPGHCNYSDAQLLGAVQKMESWIATGVKPAPLSTGLGGNFAAYTPQPFPQP